MKLTLAIDYLDLLEQFVLSDFFPEGLTDNKIGYKTDADKHDNAVIVYVPATDDAYNNFDKYEGIIRTAYENFIKSHTGEAYDYSDYTIIFTVTSQEQLLVLEIMAEEMDFEDEDERRPTELDERWDPSMSNLGDEPWNQTSFVDDNIDHMEELENKLGYTEDQLETIYDDENVLQNFENDFQKKYEEVYDSIFVKGYNSEVDELEVTDAYRAIEKTVTEETGYLNYKELRKNLDKALFRHTVESNLDSFKAIYDKYLSSNEAAVQAVQAGEIVKLQRPHDNTYTNIIVNSDGVELGDCEGCGSKTVNVKDHICKTIVDNNMGENLNKMVTRIDWFKAVLEDKEKNDIDIAGEVEYQTESLIAKYKEQYLDEVENIFPDFRGEEFNEAVEYIIDLIYDQEEMGDSDWEMILPTLKQKIEKTIKQ